jgi:Ion channel
MVGNLFVGSLMIVLTVVTHTLGLIVITRSMALMIGWLRLHAHNLGKIIAMVSTVLSLFFLHTVEVWMWATAFLALGAIASFEPALYFSTVTFSTLGYGDVTLSPQWRLFGALEAVNGFLLIGWSTAYLVAASTRHGPFRSGEHF